MALITCPECHKEISDRAATCPHCGNPLTAIQPTPGQSAEAPVYVEPVLVNKKWKKRKIFTWLAIILGFLLLGQGGDKPTESVVFWMGFCFIGYGIIALIIFHIGAWYDDRRTR
jgi:hypothetical protein